MVWAVSASQQEARTADRQDGGELAQVPLCVPLWVTLVPWLLTGVRRRFAPAFLAAAKLAPVVHLRPVALGVT
jgi:hypothetical protein